MVFQLRRSFSAEQIFHDTAGWKSLETWMKYVKSSHYGGIVYIRTSFIQTPMRLCIIWTSFVATIFWRKYETFVKNNNREAAYNPETFSLFKKNNHKRRGVSQYLNYLSKTWNHSRQIWNKKIYNFVSKLNYCLWSIFHCLTLKTMDFEPHCEIICKQIVFAYHSAKLSLFPKYSQMKIFTKTDHIKISSHLETKILAFLKQLF